MTPDEAKVAVEAYLSGVREKRIAIVKKIGRVAFYSIISFAVGFMVRGFVGF